MRYLAGILESAATSVNPATNYRTASKLVASNTYDLLISDIELPDGTGLDIIRDLESRHPTPGIAVSGFGSADDIAMSLEAGFAEHLIKPIDVRTLDAAIARVIAKPDGVDLPALAATIPWLNLSAAIGHRRRSARRAANRPASS